MKIPTWLATLIVGALFTLQAWTLNAVVELKISVATLATRLDETNHIAKANE